VLDVGCGSGILSLAAARLGAERVRGIDVDPEAVEAARGNARANRLASRCRFDGIPIVRLRAKYDLVLANLSAVELPPIVPALAARLAPGGTLVWSGLLAEEAATVPHPPALTLTDQRTRGEWVAQVFRRRGAA
jgi:ribosomal protein L11 methyltransferase